MKNKAETASRAPSRPADKRRQIRYAVVGLGHIVQAAVLPAFANARKNSVLCGLVSSDTVKLKKLAEHYEVPHTCDYKEYEAFLSRGLVDAVYIALPNHLHCGYTVRAADAGVHVLCEKPLAVDERECQTMIDACAANGVKLMTAYRLHFERANLEAIQTVKSGKIGEPRIFNSLFGMQVGEDNIRLEREMGGGTLYDIGVYCINAARYLFQAEPTEVFAYTASNADRRFREVEEMTVAVLKFPGSRMASFTCSFGAADIADFDVIGTEGRLHLSQAYEYTAPIELQLTVKDRTRKRTYAPRDQFAPELIYFSECILSNREPEPSGKEGLVDVHIIRALYTSAKQGKPVKLDAPKRQRRPALKQEIRRPPPPKGPQVDVEAPAQ